MGTLKRKILVFKNKTELSQYALRIWQSIAEASVKKHGFFSVALSGGKTPGFFYKALARSVPRSLWQDTHIFFADERFVSLRSRESNFCMIQGALLNKIGISSQHIHPMVMGEKTVKQAASSCQSHLKSFFKLKQARFPSFDLIVLGVGEDGHTASLFPGQISATKDRKLVLPVSLSTLKHERVSLSLPVINSAKTILFIVTGKSKASVVKRVILKDRKFPASQVRLRNGKIFFLLDQRAFKG